MPGDPVLLDEVCVGSFAHDEEQAVLERAVRPLTELAELDIHNRILRLSSQVCTLWRKRIGIPSLRDPTTTT